MSLRRGHCGYFKFLKKIRKMRGKEKKVGNNTVRFGIEKAGKDKMTIEF